MAFRWRVDDGPILVVFGSTHQLKIVVKIGPPEKTFLIRARPWPVRLFSRRGQTLIRKKCILNLT